MGCGTAHKPIQNGHISFIFKKKKVIFHVLLLIRISSACVSGQRQACNGIECAQLNRDFYKRLLGGLRHHSFVPTCLPACLPAGLPACLRALLACLPALLACLPACLPCLHICTLAHWHSCTLAHWHWHISTLAHRHWPSGTFAHWHICTLAHWHICALAH